MDIYGDKKHKSKLLNYSAIHLFGIELAFIEFRNYYQMIENSLASEADKRISHFNEKFEDMVAGVKEEGYAAYLDQQFAEQVTQLSYYFPHAFRSSFLIQVFSFIEFELKEICNHHHDNQKTAISLADVKGNSDLDKAKLYLTKICRVDINDLKPEWDYLLEVRKLRNTLVHHNGVLAPDHHDRKQLIPFINQNAGIEFKEQVTARKPDLTREDLTIMITGMELNEKLLTIAEQFFKKLLETGPVKITH
jgi:hypothetical protein